MFEDELNDYERLKLVVEILKQRATGGISYDADYEGLRNYFRKKEYKELIPDIFIKNRTLDVFWNDIRDKFPTYRERRAYIDSEFSKILDILEESKNIIIDISDVNVGAVNSAYVNTTWEKAVLRIEKDPEGAITSSRTLLETVLKCLAENLEITIDKSDLTKMYKEVSKKLNLSPDQHSEQVFKKILQGCVSSVDGLASLRNSYGDCHGKGQKCYTPSKRHARLAVNLAGSMAMFLIDTYEFNLLNKK